MFIPYKKSERGKRLERETLRILQTMYKAEEVNFIEPLCLTHKKISGYKIPDFIAGTNYVPKDPNNPLRKINESIIFPIQVKAWSEFSTKKYGHKAVRDTREDRSALETSKEFCNDIIGPAILYNYWPDSKWPKQYHNSDVVITSNLRPKINQLVSLITKTLASQGKSYFPSDVQSRIDDF